jgi:hypothetical protein
MVLQEENQIAMLESEAKAVTSFIGCNMSAASSVLRDGSVTKLLGSLVGPPHSCVGSHAAFRVNHLGTKLFALGKSIILYTTLLHIQNSHILLQHLPAYLGPCWRRPMRKPECNWNV